jgi:hypothetical protein
MNRYVYVHIHVYVRDYYPCTILKYVFLIYDFKTEKKTFIFDYLKILCFDYIVVLRFWEAIKTLGDFSGSKTAYSSDGLFSSSGFNSSWFDENSIATFYFFNFNAEMYITP